MDDSSNKRQHWVPHQGIMGDSSKQRQHWVPHQGDMDDRVTDMDDS